MKAVIVLACLAIAASAMEFQSVKSSNPFSSEAPMELPVWESVVADLQKMSSSMQRHMAVQSKSALAATNFGTFAVSAGCQTSIDALAGVYVSAACQSLGQLNLQDPTVATMDAFCGSTCVADIQAKLDVVGTSCTGADASIYANATFAAEIRRASKFINTICLKEGTTYCFLLLKDASVQFNQVTSTLLDKICTPCTAKIVLAAAQYGDEDGRRAAVYLDLLCMKRGDPPIYCMPQLQTMSAQMTTAAQTGDFSAICHPCVASMFAKMIELSARFSDDQTTIDTGAAYRKLGQTLRAFCQKSNGEFCINIIFRVAQSLGEAAASSGCPEDPTATSPCVDSCKAFAANVKAQLGCCLPGFLQMAGLEGDGVRLWIQNQCGLEIGLSCSTKKVKALFRITNLRFAYYQANKAAVEAKIKADLALFAGVLEEDVELEAVSEVTANAAAGKGLTLFASAGLDVKYTITPADEAQAATIEANILSGAAVALPNTAQLPLDSREQPTAAIGVDTSASTAEQVQAGAASVAQASFAALLLAAAFALFAARQ